MRTFLLLLCAVVFAGNTLAEDIAIEDFPVERVRTCLPEHWYVESIKGELTVSGWNKSNGSNGIRVTITRVPYDTVLRPTRGRGLAVAIPRFYLYVFPFDFEGEHVDNAEIFRRGEIITARSANPSAKQILVMNEFEAVEDWYVFHNSPTFRDWKAPVAEIIKKLEEALEGYPRAR
jgi:hypothetical protein